MLVLDASVRGAYVGSGHGNWNSGMTRKSRRPRLVSLLVGGLLSLSGQVSAAADFWCETFVERPREVQELIVSSWLAGTYVENQYYRLNALTARVENALSELEPGTRERDVLTTNVGAAIEHMKKINSMLIYAERNREAVFSRVQEYCARPEIKGATVLEIIPYAIDELMRLESDGPRK